MKCKPVRCLDTMAIYESQTEAAKQLGLWATHISHVCTGARKTTGKLRFEFVDEVDIIKALARRQAKEQTE